MKKIILSLLLIVAGMFGMSRMVFAGSSVLFVSPASLNGIAGKAFDVSIRLDPAGNSVCVVKGTMNFSNLSCQSITVANGFMAQTAPSCASPSFIIGIPKCTEVAQAIFSVAVKGDKAGQGSLSLTDVKVIGMGADVPFSSQNGIYDITAVQPAVPKATPIAKPVIKPQVSSITEPVIAPVLETASSSVGEAIEQLFDIVLTIENGLLDRASDLVARTQFTSFGTVPTLVNMVYRIEDVRGREVYTENGEVTVETEQIVTKEFKNLDLVSGKYTLFLATTYGDNIQDEFKQAFEVKITPISEEKVSISFWAIVATILIIFGGFIYLLIKRKKVQEKKQR